MCPNGEFDCINMSVCIKGGFIKNSLLTKYFIYNKTNILKTDATTTTRSVDENLLINLIKSKRILLK